MSIITVLCQNGDIKSCIMTSEGSLRQWVHIMSYA